jgi:zinc transport system ATP-binding protein
MPMTGQPPPGQPPTSARPVIVEVRDGTVALGGRPVLRAIDLTVGQGEVMALLGANGSGKSTLVRTMMGLVPVTRGRVSLFGTPLSRFHDWRRIGFVPQRMTATSGVPASVWEVVAAGRLSRRPFLRPLRKKDRTAIREAIEAVGLSGRAHDGCSTLSGGQQQRVLIARALAGEPDLFVLDEPTAGVDLASQQAFADALAALVERGVTIILVAHELGPLAPLVDRTVVMRDGRIAYDGPPLAPGHAVDEHTWADHGHHHPALQPGDPDYAPTVSSPIEAASRREPPT